MHMDAFINHKHREQEKKSYSIDQNKKSVSHKTDSMDNLTILRRGWFLQINEIYQPVSKSLKLQAWANACAIAMGHACLQVALNKNDALHN